MPTPGEFATNERAAIIDDFHRLWYDVGVRQDFGWMTWLGYRVMKFPGDLIIYQEILVETRPDLVIETGTYNGGSALFLATIMDAIGHGTVLTIDVEDRAGRPEHPRIEYLTASSTAPETLAVIEARAGAVARVMVVLDSDHSKRHVGSELESYAPFVSAGCYLIVEDTNVNGHPVVEDFGPGPMEAVREFLPHHPEFEVDASREKLLLTWNPSGYLRRIVPDTIGDDDLALRTLADHGRRLETKVEELTVDRQQATARALELERELSATRGTKMFRYTSGLRSLYRRVFVRGR